MTKHTILNYLQPDSKTLGSLLSRLAQLNQWNRMLCACLSEENELSKHCQIVNLSNNSLIVIADNPHWVTRLRFHIPELLPKLRACAGLEKIQAICCKVQPHYTKIKYSKRRPQRVLSTKTAEAIREVANKLSDRKLRDILEKIASRV